MVRKPKITKDDSDQTQDVEVLFEVEGSDEAPSVAETVPVLDEVEAVPVAMPVIEAEVTASPDADDMHSLDLETLALKLTELEAKVMRLEIELSTLVKKKGIKKEKKVKCKCKGKKVPLSKCKCASKKLSTPK